MIKPKLLLITLLIYFVSLTSVLAWFVFEDNKNITIELGKFDLKIETSLYNESMSVNLNDEQTRSKYYDVTTNTLKLDGNNVSKENNINNLVVNLIIDSELQGYFRIKIKDEWKIIRSYKNSDTIREEILLKDGTKFTSFNILNPDLIKVDLHTNYIYYTSIIPKGKSIINFINGGINYRLIDNEIFSEECVINLNFEFEIVQANRYQQVYGINSFEELSNLF